MAYFAHTRPQAPYEPAFQQHAQGPVDEDGDRLYTEEDYAVHPQGNSPDFLPDEVEEQQNETQDLFSDVAPLDEELLTEEEQAELRASRWQLLAGIMDFAGVIAGTAVILLLIALLVSLLNWVHADVTQFFTLWQTKL